MRHRGTIAEHKPAERFVHYRAAQHIEAEVRPAQDTGYAVWVLLVHVMPELFYLAATPSSRSPDAEADRTGRGPRRARRAC